MKRLLTPKTRVLLKAFVEQRILSRFITRFHARFPGMQFLRSVLGAGGADKEIPYKPGEPYREAWGAWTHSPGTSKVGADGRTVCNKTLESGDSLGVK